MAKSGPDVFSSADAVSDKRSHLFLKNTATVLAGYREKSRGSGAKADEKEPGDSEPESEATDNENFTLDLLVMRQCSQNFESQKFQRHQKRTLQGLQHQDYVVLSFAKPVHSSLLKLLRKELGLLNLYAENYHCKLTFAVAESELFESFLKAFQTQRISDTPLPESLTEALKTLQDFHLLSTQERFQIPSKKQHDFTQANFQLFDSVELFEQERQMQAQLLAYLDQQAQKYSFIPEANLVELYTQDLAFVEHLLDNFDIIYTVQSMQAGVIGPDAYNQPGRSYGFTLQSNGQEPVIGVIDSGISAQTPLKSILIDDPAFDLTHTHPLTDEEDHGTAVALLAAVGERFYQQQERERLTQLNFQTDARLLSIKIIADKASGLPYQKVLELIEQAHKTYKVRLFTLTICQQTHMQDHALVSPHAYLLDKLAAKLDILICISAGNRNNFLTPKAQIYPDLFQEDASNLKSPAEAMNHLTIGAIAQNFEPLSGLEFTPDKSFPAPYTGKSQWYHAPGMFRTRDIMYKHLFKPDLVHAGGDYDQAMSHGAPPGLEVLSKDPTQSYYRHAGTSFATPLVANQAAQLMALYPDLRMQTIKALLINSAENPWGSKNMPEALHNVASRINYLIGHGQPDLARCLYSYPERAIMIVEDKIKVHKNMMGISLALPEGLAELTNQRVLRVTATLCYAFQPVLQGHFNYCPVFVTFGFLQDRDLSELNNQKKADIDFNPQSGWAADAYYQKIPFSNVQKKSFLINKKHLVDQDNQIQLVFKSKWHSTLSDVQKRDLPDEQRFSFVLELEALGKNNTFDLYAELQAINHLEAVADLSAELEIDDLEI